MTARPHAGAAARQCRASRNRRWPLAGKVSAASPFACGPTPGSRILTELERRDEALALARAKSEGADATLADLVRTGDLLVALDRHAEAADVYDRAIAQADRAPEMADASGACGC